MRTVPWHICVLIPARDEQELLARCLRSVITAGLALGQRGTLDLVVAVDSSTDATLQIAEQMVRGHGTVVSTAAGLVGAARAVAATIALARYNGPRHRCWFANTDADCIVPPDWLRHHLSFADQQVEAVAGIVDIDSFREHQPIVAERFRATYLVGSDGSHSHVHGANLGIRADAYLRAGGWNSLATAEDHDLWRRLSNIGAQKISTSQLKVTTSGRKVGRAPHGFAEALAAHNESA